MPTVRFERDQLPSTAWKNGGGRTREIVRLPPESGMDAFDWRASIADISADGPFSTFVGFDRVIVLLDGDGARLRSSNATVDHRLDEPLVPYAFAGEDAIVASLVGGASSDFNIMTRRAAAHADVRVVRARERSPRAPRACSSRDEACGTCARSARRHPTLPSRAATHLGRTAASGGTVSR